MSGCRWAITILGIVWFWQHYICSKEPASCVSMTQRVMPAAVSAPGRSNHAGQVKGWSPDESHSPSPPGWGLCQRPTISSRKQILRKHETPLLVFCGGGAGYSKNDQWQCKHLGSYRRGTISCRHQHQDKEQLHLSWNQTANRVKLENPCFYPWGELVNK